MTSETNQAAESGEASVVLARFVRGNPDGWLKVTESRVLSAGDFMWDGSLTEFLAALDPGSAHDWVRGRRRRTLQHEPLGGSHRAARAEPVVPPAVSRWERAR